MMDRRRAGGAWQPAAAGSQPPARPLHVPAWAYALAMLCALLLGATAVVRTTSAIATAGDSDLTNFFLKSAAYVVRGDPWHLYAVRSDPPTLGVPNDGTPLSILLMAPLLAAARRAGSGGNLGQAVTSVSLPFVLLAPLLGGLVVGALRRLSPGMPARERFLAFLLVTFSPLLWLCFETPWGHFEQPLLLCFLVPALLAFQARREALAGVLAGLAVYAGVVALFPLLALGALLLARRQWRALATVGGIGALVVVVGMAPFFLVDRADTLYSLVTWRPEADVTGSSVWSYFALNGALLPVRPPLQHLIAAVVRRADLPATLLLIVLVAFRAVRRLDVSAYAAEAWAVFSIAGLAMPMLNKRNWPYYYLEPFVLLLIWEFGTLQGRRSALWRWPVLTIGFLLLAGTLSQDIGMKSVGALDRIVLGLLQFGAMLAVAVAAWKRLQDRSPAASGAEAGGASGEPAG